MGYDVCQETGIVIVDLPEDEQAVINSIHFLPATMFTKEKLDRLVARVLADSKAPIYQILIAHMKWRMPQLVPMLKNISGVMIEAGPNRKLMKACYCEIIFNKFFGTFEDRGSETSTYKIDYNGTSFSLSSTMLPESFGLPVFINDPLKN